MKKRNPKKTEGLQATISPAPKAPKQKAKSARPRRYVRVDYPMEGENIMSEFYTFRISASPTDRVEISIDHGEWLPCRPSVGYWWFDWSHFSAGPHSLQARIPPEGSRDLKSRPHQFTAFG